MCRWGIISPTLGDYFPQWCFGWGIISPTLGDYFPHFFARFVLHVGDAVPCRFASLSD